MRLHSSFLWNAIFKYIVTLCLLCTCAFVTQLWGRMEDMNLWAKMNMLVGKILFSSSLLDTIYFRDYISFTKRKEKENTWKYSKIFSSKKCMFILHLILSVLSSHFEKGPNEIATDSDYCLCTFRKCFERIHIVSFFTLLYCIDIHSSY